MTLAGKNTKIEIYSLEEMELMLLLCQMEIILYQLAIVFPSNNNLEYLKIISSLLETIKLKSYKVCFILFPFL